MIKKIITLVLALIMSLIMIGCTPKEQRDVTASGRFKILESTFSDIIYCDTVTGVCYWEHGYGLTVLLNEQGLPLIYDEG